MATTALPRSLTAAVRARWMPALALCGLVAACAPTGARPSPAPGTQPPTRTGADDTPRATAAPTASSQRRSVVSLGRLSGTSVQTRDADGTVHSVLHVLENGRGPHTEATYTLAEDGTFIRFSARGHHSFGAPFTAEFHREGRRATWSSPEETGRAELAEPTEPALYYPVAELPEIAGLVVQAARRHGGALRILPAGTVQLEELGQTTVTAGGQRRTLVAVAIRGLSFLPEITWMNQDGSWFGSVSEWFSTVPEGWERAIDPLLEVQRGHDRARDARLAGELAQRPPPAGLAYTHARILDVERGRWLPDHTLVVVGDRIAALGPSARTRPPAGAQVVDLAGKAIVPGLIDMHVHLDDADGILHLASGVTMVRDVGNDPDKLDELKRAFDEGKAIGPRVVRFGLIEGRGEKAASSEVTAETPQEARAAVDEYARRGYEGIKIYNSVRPELVPLLAAEANQRGMAVTGHVPVHMLARDVVTAGFDGIEHINMLVLNFAATRDTDTRDTTRFTLVGDKAPDLDLGSAPVQEFLQLLRTHNTVVDPTVNAFEDLLVWEQGKVQAGLEELVARLPILPRRTYLMGGLPVDEVKHQRYVAAFDKLLQLIKVMVDGKQRVVLGTDSLAGLMYHHEARLFARAGISPVEILRMATIAPASYLGIAQRHGSLAVGKAADLVVVEGDPLARIADLGRTVIVMRAGVAYSCAALYAAVGVTR